MEQITVETEPLFINSYTMTKEVLREFHWRASRFRLVFILMATALVMVCAATIPGLISGEGKQQIFLLVMVLICCGLMAFSYFFTVNMNWKRVSEQANGKPVRAIISFTEENAVNETEGLDSRVVLEYASVKKVIVTKNLIILMTRARLGHILRRDSFTKGAEEEFMKFINAKLALNKLK